MTPIMRAEREVARKVHRAQLDSLTADHRRRVAERLLRRGALLAAEDALAEQMRQERDAMAPARPMPAGMTADSSDDDFEEMIARAMLEAKQAESEERSGPRPTVEVQIDGKPTTVLRWHAQRAHAALTHFERIDSCGQGNDFIQVNCSTTCKEDGKRICMGCNKRDCPTCRPKIQRSLRNSFRRGFQNLENEAETHYRGRLRHGQKRPLGTKFLTLTAPHYEAGPVNGEHFEAVPRRIEAVFAAWKVFARWFRDTMVARSKGRQDLCHFARAWEWTEGADGKGHPHFHVLFHGPYMDREDVAAAWSDALERVTGEPAERVIVDIRAVTAGTGAVELVKYILKDLSDAKRDRFVAAESLAQVLETVWNRRLRQTSAGFAEWRDTFVERPVCPCCQHERKFAHVRETISVRIERAEEERAPPAPPPVILDRARLPWTQATLFY